MGVLQNEFDRIIKELCTVKSLKVMLLRRVAEARDLTLTDEQIETLAKSIGADSGSDIARVELEGLTEEVVITSDDLEVALKRLEGDMEDHVERGILSALDELPAGILQSLYADLPEALRHRRGNEEDFRERLFARWKEGLDRLEMLIMIAQESGGSHIDDMNSEPSEENGTSDDDASIQEALVALHVRACRTASEVLCLLRGGFADGANARWRSLHEVAVTAMFLMEHPGDTARRYLDHAAVERLRSAEKYQEHCHTLRYEPFTKEELAELQREADAVIQKYGKSFRKDYGWAANALANKEPTFAQVEAALRMEHWRPFYKMACQSVHAGSQALHFCLSHPTGADPMLIAGATNAGLADPGHTAAISLTMASVALFTFRPNLDSLIVCKCMQQLCDDIGDAFITAHEQLETEIDPSASVQ
jgi:Family of unknown function (DUF5677)